MGHEFDWTGIPLAQALFFDDLAKRTGARLDRMPWLINGMWGSADCSIWAYGTREFLQPIAEQAPRSLRLRTVHFMAVDDTSEDFAIGWFLPDAEYEDEETMREGP